MWWWRRLWLSVLCVLLSLKVRLGLRYRGLNALQAFVRNLHNVGRIELQMLHNSIYSRSESHVARRPCRVGRDGLISDNTHSAVQPGMLRIHPHQGHSWWFRCRAGRQVDSQYECVPALGLEHGVVRAIVCRRVLSFTILKKAVSRRRMKTYQHDNERQNQRSGGRTP